MADRQLKIVVRTEIRKGFADLNKQMQQLSSSIQKLSGLASSIDRLASSFDKVGAKTNAVASATRSLNKEAAAGARIAQGQASAQDKLIRQVGQLKSAEKSAAITKQQALQSEIKLINEVIRKTGDLTILEKRRDSKGRFGYGGLSADAVRAVKATYVSPQSAPTYRMSPTAYGPRNLSSTPFGPSTSSFEKEQAAWWKIDETLRRRNSRFTFTPTNPGNNIFSSDSTQSSRIRNAVGGMTRGDSANTEYYRNLQAQQDREEKIAARNNARLAGGYGGGRKGPGGSYPGLPSGKDVEISDKLYKNYTKLGHALFLLQQTTLTIFAASGVAQVIEQADAYITLRNQVARTSDSINDLGANMKAVFGIANKTFTDVKSVGTLFSTINKYSQNLGINKEQVAGVTGAISAAYAASPGTADSKSAAQYQLIQAISSNRLGGDELRSQLEQAPPVAEILGKGVAKLRGQEGKTIDLRDKDNPVRTKELVQVFGDPEVQKNLNKLMAEQSRTFSDVLMVAKNRVTEYMGKIQESTGFFTSLNKTMATFIAGDGFDKLMKGLGDAAFGLGVFAATLLATSALKAGGSAVNGIVGQVGAVKNFANARGAYRAATSTARMSGADLASGLITTEQAMARGATAGVAGDALAASKNALAGPLKFIADLFFTVGGAASKFRIVLAAVGSVVTIIAVVIGVLAARFSHLLGETKTNITILDVLVGLWNKLSDVLKIILKPLNAVVDWFWSLIDGPLKALVGWAINDKDVKAARDKRLKNAADEQKNLPVNQKADLPTPKETADKKAKQMAEKWREFIRDMNNTYASINFDMNAMPENLPEQFQSAFDTFGENVKKAADILKLNTKGKGLGEILDQITKIKGKEFANMNLDAFEQNVQKIYGDQLDAYSKSIKEAALSSVLDMSIPGLTRRGRADRSNNNNLINQFIDSVNPESAMSALKNALAQNGADTNSVSTVSVEGKSRRERVADVYKQFGSARAADYVRGGLDEPQQALFDKLSQSQKENFAREEALTTSWKAGIMDSVAAYYDKITDSAAIWGNVVTNALQSLEDTLTNYLTDPSFSKGKSGTEVAKDFGRGVLKDVGKAFVQQRIMKPILDMFGLGGSKELGATAAKPMWVKNVDQALGKLFGGSGDSAGGGLGDIVKKAGSWISSIFGGGSGGTGVATTTAAGTGGWLQTAATWLSSLFHGGGVAGSATMSRGVHPGVFANAKYYHTGGVAGMPALNANEVPAILTRGEKIMTLAQQASEKRNSGTTVSSPVYSPQIEINYTAGQGSNTSEQDAAQMAQQFREASQLQFQQFLLKELKQGGMLAK